MTDIERRLLELVERHLHGHHCDMCGKEWLTGKSVGVLFHRCVRPPRGIYSWDRETDRQRWATQLFGALESAVGDAALLEGEDTE